MNPNQNQLPPMQHLFQPSFPSPALPSSMFSSLSNNADENLPNELVDGYSPLEGDNFDDFSLPDGEVSEEEQLDYTTLVRKIMRFETAGYEKLTNGKHKDLRGEFCFIENYDSEHQKFELTLLGNPTETTVMVPEVCIKRVEYGKMPDTVKEILKLYRQSYGKYESTRRYLSRLFSKLSEMSSEINHNLQQIHRIGVETFQQTLSRATRLNQDGFMDFQPSHTSPSALGSPAIRGSHPGQPYLNKPLFNQAPPHPPLNPIKPPLAKSTDKEGFRTFKKTLLGEEKAHRERDKRGKLKKKASIALKPNHIYYIKLNTGAVLMIYVKSEEYAPKKYRRQYYSEFGMVEAREIASYIEKEASDPGTEKLKELYRRIFTLEKSIERTEQKKAEKDVELLQWEKKRDGYRGLLNPYLRKGIREKEVTRCARREIDFDVVKEGTVTMFAIRYVEKDLFRYIHKKYGGHIQRLRYAQEKKLVLIPLGYGVRRSDVSELLKDLIKRYGHKDNKELYDKLNELVPRYL